MQCGFQVEDFGMAKNSTNVQFVALQVQLSNLVLSYSRKDFIVVCYTGKNKICIMEYLLFLFYENIYTSICILHCTTLIL